MAEGKNYSRIRTDFVVRWTFLPGKRRKQGYRSDLRYKGDEEQNWVIWPIFLTNAGVPYEDSAEVPLDRPIEAAMVIIFDDSKVSVHRNRIKIGTEFYMCEGSLIVAEGVVTRITGLFDD